MTPLQYETTQEKRFDGGYRGIFAPDNFMEGKYHCIVCDEHLFNSEDRHIYHYNETIKFGGWASFDRPTENVVDITEHYKKYDKGQFYHTIFFTTNIEALCKNCGAFLGKVHTGNTTVNYPVDSLGIMENTFYVFDEFYKMVTQSDEPLLSLKKIYRIKSESLKFNPNANESQQKGVEIADGPALIDFIKKGLQYS